MYELIKKEGWEFNVDIHATKEYYRKYSDLCNCGGCRNFYRTIRGASAEVIAFLDQFGIDIEKPIETEWFVIDKHRKIIDYTVYYAVHGKAAKASYEIDFGTVNIVVQTQKNSPNSEMPEPYFVFQIFNLLLPWVLSDNIEELDNLPKTKNKNNIKKPKSSIFSFCKTSEMVPEDCESKDDIKNLVFSKLASILDVSMIRIDEQHGYFIIDSVNGLGIEFCGSEVIIYYSEEHHHIMGMDFKTMDEWASEVDRFLRLLINRKVKLEYYLKGNKQIRIKIYSLHNGNEELIEHKRTTLNPLLLSTKNTRKEFKVIEFKQQ